MVRLKTYFQLVSTVDEGTIFRAACLTKGAYGISYMNADQFRHILICTKNKKKNRDHRDQIAILAQNVISEIVDQNSLTCQMIPLSKTPDVGPIRVAEVLRQII